MKAIPLSMAAMHALAQSASDTTGVPVPLLLAVSRAESDWRPDARRDEPQIGDASHGLMQVLEATARAVGYRGSVGTWNALSKTGSGLYDPRTNLEVGGKFLADLLRSTNGDIARAVSAYNVGLSRAVKATQPYRFCLAWKPSAPKSGRSLDRDCALIRDVKVGEYPNQPYVNKVLAYYNEYVRTVAGGGGGARPAAGQPVGTTPLPSTTHSFVVRTVPAVLLAALMAAWFILRGGR